MNWEKLRPYFPVTKKYIYLDHGSMSPLPTCVLEILYDFHLRRYFSGRNFVDWWKEVSVVRSKLAKFIGAEPEEIAFTESTTHGINIIAQGLNWQPGENMIINNLEFPANVYPWLNLHEKGVEVRIHKSINGELFIEKIAKLIDEKTKLISISHVQANNGFRSDISLLGKLCKKKNVLLLVDATQSLGAFPVNVKDSNLNFLCGATFKWLLGPDGLGFLYCNKDNLPNLNLTYLGWAGMKNRNNFTTYQVNLPDEARCFELGNLNFSAIYGLSAALDFINKIGVKAISKRIISLVDFLNGELVKIPAVICRNQFPKNNLGGLITFDVPSREEVYFKLTQKGIITALRHNGIRISPHFYNTIEELDFFIKTLKHLVRMD